MNGSNQPVRETHVSSEILKLKESVKSVNQSFGNLSDRISKILRSESTVPKNLDEKIPELILVGLAQEIKDERENLDNLKRWIESIFDRIEL